MGQAIFQGQMPGGPAPGSEDMSAYLFGSQLADCRSGRRSVFVVLDGSTGITDPPHMTRRRVRNLGPCLFIHVCSLKYAVMTRHSQQFLWGVHDLEI